MKHKAKTKLARKLRTHQELKDRVSIFLTQAWESRKQARARRADRINLVRQSWALAKKAKRKNDQHEK